MCDCWNVKQHLEDCGCACHLPENRTSHGFFINEETGVIKGWSGSFVFEKNLKGENNE